MTGRPRIVIGGLGPAGPDLLTAGTLAAIDRIPRRFLRTRRHPASSAVPDAVDFDYAARITALNATTLASLAWAPASPDSVTIIGATTPNTTLRWVAGRDADLAGYRVYWRRPAAPQWEHSRWVGNVTEATLAGVIIDNHFFGVAAVDRDGHESRPVFPQPGQ